MARTPFLSAVAKLGCESPVAGGGEMGALRVLQKYKSHCYASFSVGSVLADFDTPRFLAWKSDLENWIHGPCSPKDCGEWNGSCLSLDVLRTPYLALGSSGPLSRYLRLRMRGSRTFFFFAGSADCTHEANLKTFTIFYSHLPTAFAVQRF